MSNLIFPDQVRGLAYSVTKTQENSVNKNEADNFLSTRALNNLNPRWHWRLTYDWLTDNPLKPNPIFSYTDLQQFLGFVQARYNEWDDFLYTDPDDNTVGPGVITAAWVHNYPYTLGDIILAAGHAQQVINAPGAAKSGFLAPTFNVAGGTTNDGGLTWQDLGASAAYPNPKAELQVVTDGTTYYSPVQRNLGGQFFEDITDLNGAITVYDNGSVTSAYHLSWGLLSFTGFQSFGIYLTWNSQPVGPVTATFNYFFRVRFEDSTQDFEKFADKFWAVGGEQGSSGKGYLKLTNAPIPKTLTIPNTFPPLTPPTAGLRMAIIYPKTITLSVNGHPGVTFLATIGSAAGVAGQGAFFSVKLFHQFFSSSGGNAQFGGYALPAYVPAGAVKYIYAYNPYTFAFSGTGNYGFAAADIHVPGYGFNPYNYLFSNQPGSFVSIFARIDNLYGGPLAAFPYDQVVQTFFIFASLQQDYNNTMIGSPLMIVWY